MNVVCFEYKAKYGHFLRAEANANGVTYPVPPRTALLGLIAAVLGLPKDALAHELAEARSRRGRFGPPPLLAQDHRAQGPSRAAFVADQEDRQGLVK